LGLSTFAIGASSLQSLGIRLSPGAMIDSVIFLGLTETVVPDLGPFLQSYSLANLSRFPDRWPISGMDHWQGSYGGTVPTGQPCTGRYMSHEITSRCPPQHTLLPIHEVFVGRQPIYTRQLDVFAYELLFRSGEMQHAGVTDGNQATAHVLVNTFLELGLDTLVGSKRAFVNLTRDFLLQDYVLGFPADRVVLEVLEDVAVDDDVLAALRNLSAQGYIIALDDFFYREHLRPLVELADIIKIDVLASGRRTVAEQVKLLRQYDVQLLAEKVETQEDFTYYKTPEVWTPFIR
jgi:hypothetical protein